MHPLLDNLQELKESELDAKITDLTKKYFMTSNPSVQAQIVLLLDAYKVRLVELQREKLKYFNEKMNNGLDKLVNIN